MDTQLDSGRWRTRNVSYFVTAAWTAGGSKKPYVQTILVEFVIANGNDTIVEGFKADRASHFILFFCFYIYYSLQGCRIHLFLTWA